MSYSVAFLPILMFAGGNVAAKYREHKRHFSVCLRLNCINIILQFYWRWCMIRCILD